MLKKKTKNDFSCIDEAVACNQYLVPKMYATTAAVAPVVLEVPLFAVLRKKTSSEKLPDVDAVWFKKGRGYVRYTGPQLVQAHLTVLLTLVNLRAGQAVDNAFVFRPSELLKLMGWSDNSRNLERLIELLDDLKRGQVRLWKDGQDEKKDSQRLSFVDAFQPAQADDWYVQLSKQLMPLFHGTLTFINLKTRAKLNEGLATFMHGFLCANACNADFTYKELHIMSGSRCADLGEFADSVKAALAKLKEAGAIKDYRLARGTFRVLK